MMKLRSSFILSCSLALALVAGAQEYTIDDLNELEAERQANEEKLQAIEGAVRNAERDIASINRQLIAAAQESRRREEQASATELKLIDLNVRRETARRSLLSDREGLEDLIAALLSAKANPPPSLIVSPDSAEDAVRAAILMSSATPELQARTIALEEELNALRKLIRDIEREKDNLQSAEAVLADKRIEIESLAAAKRAQFEDVTLEAKILRKEIESIGARMNSLQGLLNELEKSAPSLPRLKPKPSVAFAGADVERTTQIALVTGPDIQKPLRRLLRPTVGDLALSFGEKTKAGTISEGLYYSTRSAAQIIAPADARIEYAGEFRTYGQMLILRTSDGYHIILSGLETLYGTPGQWVLSGEPIGRMPDETANTPQLYLELRKDGSPIDPSKWIKTQAG